MIFVTLGTQNFNFLRLLEAVENAVRNNVLKERVVAQIGYNKFESDYIQCIPFIEKVEFLNYINESKFIISHAGTGSIISALNMKKKIIVAPRLVQFDEHIDDHQLEILKVFAQQNLIIPLRKDLSDIEEKIKNVDNYVLNDFISNTIYFNTKLTSLIKEL